MEKPLLKKRKILKARCPGCQSSQIRKRKLLGNWKCDRCGKVFKEPKSDPPGDDAK